MGMLRFLLAIAVVIAHGMPETLIGNIINPTTAVEVFFVISGFYMQMVLLDKYKKDKLGERFYISFWKSRYLRLYPAYFLSISLTIIYLFYFQKPSPNLSAHDHSFALESHIKELFYLSNSLENILLKLYFFISNFFIFFSDLVLNLAVVDGNASIVFNRSVTELYVASTLINSPSWSLGVELTFYILAPFILTQRNSRFYTILLAALFIKATSIIFGEMSDLYYRSFPYVLFNFLLGASVYRLRHYLTISLFNKGFTTVIVYSFCIFSLFKVPTISTSYSIPIILFWGLLIPTIFNATKSNRYDRFIGELSYPIYIFHYFFYMVIIDYWQAFSYIAVYFNTNASILINSVTLFLVIVFSTFYVLFESWKIEPLRYKISFSNTLSR